MNTTAIDLTTPVGRLTAHIIDAVAAHESQQRPERAEQAVDRCVCGHDFEQHDPIDDEFAGACAECDCEEFRRAA